MMKRDSLRNRVWITDTALVTALGDSPGLLWEGLMAGQSGIRGIQRFRTEGYVTGRGAHIEELAPDADGDRMVPLIRRLVSAMEPPPPDAGLIAATTKSGISRLEQLQTGGNGNPDKILLRALPEALSREFGLKDRGIVISAACASSTIALGVAAARIASGRREAVLVCGLDLLTEFVFSGFSALRALSPSPCRPFDRDRDGLSLGEGAGAVLLMSESRARRENRPCRAVLSGWGNAGDAAHITAPDRNGEGLALAIRSALDQAEISPEAVAAVCAHGTGTVFNDLMELAAFQNVFGDRPLPAHSVKGAVGHTMGAAGVIEAVLGTEMLRHQTVPPTVGFEAPEKGAEGRISRSPQAFQGDHLLSVNSGFGGVNAAIVLERGDF